MRTHYQRDELMADHDYATPHMVEGVRLHGGFDADGTYVSPRTLHRWPAVRAWQAQLAERGAPLIEATTALLGEPNFPNEAQQRLLLENGLGQTLWDSLTITGIIEGRGKLLAQFVGPDFQEIVVEDISGMALGHLNEGLYEAHGLDEGGADGSDVGAHDAMWFVARDLLFGAGAWPEPQAPASISRDVEGREMPQIAEAYEQTLKLLMNVLMIEVRAERGFSFNQNVIRTPALFTDRPEARELAAEMIERIRTDEAIHVAYLQTVISEFRSLTIRTLDGREVPGSEIVDPVWSAMVQWHAVDMHRVNRPRAHAVLLDRLRQAGREDLIGPLDALWEGEPIPAPEPAAA